MASCVKCRKCFFKIFCMDQKDKECDLYLDSEYVANLKRENEKLKAEVNGLRETLHLIPNLIFQAKIKALKELEDKLREKQDNAASFHSWISVVPVDDVNDFVKKMTEGAE